MLLRNYDTPNDFYSMGDLEQLQPLVEELIATRSQQVNQRRKHNRKYIADPKAFDSDGVAALASDQDNQIAWLKTSYNNPMSEAFMAVRHDPMDASLYNMSGQIETDINTISERKEGI